MSVKTVAQLKTTAAVIRDETAIGGNTKLRVYNMLIDLIDSLCLILDIATVSTASGTIDFDFALKQARKFLGSASFATAKSITFSNATNAVEFDFFFQITNVAAILTFPSSVIMNDVRWNTSGQTWEASEIGIYKASALFDGTNWIMDISNPYA